MRERGRATVAAVDGQNVSYRWCQIPVRVGSFGAVDGWAHLYPSRLPLIVQNRVILSSSIECWWCAATNGIIFLAADWRRRICCRVH